MLRKDLALVAIMCTILMLMIVPLSQTLMDVFLALNISMAVLLLMVGIYLKHPSDFSTFPSVILIGTAFRLALSIGTTRLILSEADAGQIVETFGEFVVAGSVAIGLVIFLIITVVQFLVVTKGAERVAEVGARFALDALPGKQMSIDADIRAGALDQEEGALKRKQLDRDSQFFGAMDGAMKFVKGDAIAGLIIIVINLIGGIAVGVSIHGYGFSEAVSVYSLLTIGDGLVAQIPALMMSLSAGVIVTRAVNADNVDLGTDIVSELVADPRVPGVAAVVVLAMGFIPGFPMLVFAGAASALVMIWWVMSRSIRLREAEEIAAAEAVTAADEAAAVAEALKAEEAKQEPAADDGVSRSDRFRVLLQPGAGGLDLQALQASVDRAFKRLYQVRGIKFLAATIETSTTAPDDGCLVELDEVPIHSMAIPNNCILVAGGPEILDLVGCAEEDAVKVSWISFTGWWLPDRFTDALHNLSIVLPVVEDRMAQQIYRLYERNLGRLLSKNEFEGFLADSRAVDSEMVDQIEQQLGRNNLMQILRYLVEDGVPLRPIRLLVDSLSHWTHVNEGLGPLMIAECMRGSMKRQLCHSIAGPNGVLGVAMVDPQLETLARNAITEAKRTGQSNIIDGLLFDNDTTDEVLQQFRNLQIGEGQDSHQLAVVASTDIRRRLRNFLTTNNIHLPVLAPHEISSDVTCCPLEVIGGPATVSRARAEPVRNPRQSV
ncbi:MAG: flagellar biosynthesis protein FlhA [Sulfitobacter sp.]